MLKKYANFIKETRIALAQINVTVGDLSGNTDKIIASIQKAKNENAHIIVFPELAITGYPPEDLLYKKSFIAENRIALKKIIAHTKNIAVVVGFVDNDKKGHIYNAAAIVINGVLKSIYHKSVLPNYGVFDEKRYFKKGTTTKVFSYRGIQFGVSICEDIWTEKNPYLEKRPAMNVLLNISASPFCRGKKQERRNIITACAKKLKAAVCYCNLVGGQDELVFDGGSLCANFNGKLVCSGKMLEEEMIFCIIKADQKIRSRQKRPSILISQIEKIGDTGNHRDFKKNRSDETSLMYQALTLGTKDYILKNGFQKAVLGLSGGIDSALVAAIAADAIGHKNVVGVSMPGPYTSFETKRDARRLAQNLNIEFLEIPIHDIYKKYLQILKKFLRNKNSGLVRENLQARIRGNILMALSNQSGALVLSTGNKSEIAVGYCTLYGDMAGGLAVIKDVPKTKVYELVKFRNARSGKNIILESIINRAPSAELKKNQKDQDSLPAYDTLDVILEEYIEEEKFFSKKNIFKNSTLTRDIVRLVDRMEYKRRQGPPGIKMTPKAFGKDRRLPITNCYYQ